MPTRDLVALRWVSLPLNPSCALAQPLIKFRPAFFIMARICSTVD